MTDDKWKIITLDWDSFRWDWATETWIVNISISKAYEIIKFILHDRKDIEKIKVYASPNLDGYHIYIYFDHWLLWNEVIHLRRRYKDDSMRIINEFFKDMPEDKMTMFSEKNGRKEIYLTEFWPQRYEMPNFIQNTHSQLL